MKKLFVLILLIASSYLASAQVFNTASTLKPGAFSLGVEPVVYDRDFGLFLHGGIGIKSGIDLGLKYGFLNGSDYFGADLEWRLMAGKPNISLTTGAHSFYDPGLDLGLNLSFPITKGAGFYTGLDLDINFGDHNTYTPLWLPVGVEISLKKNMSFIFEDEIPLNDAYNILGLGLAFYF